MTQLRFVPASFAASAVLLLSSFAGAIVAPGAPAPGCGTGPACAYGFECTVVATSGCASAACPPGQTCPAPEPCAVTEERACTPTHCTADTDCASGMVCHEWTEPCAVSDCACAPNTKCDCAPTTCEPTKLSMCTPRYVLPCTTAADCGNGFSCEPQGCGCANGGSAGGATPSMPLPAEGAAGAASEPAPMQDPLPPTDCGCPVTPQMSCVVQDMMCQSDAQCPAGWLCEQEAVPSSAPACAGADCPMEAPAPMPVSAHCRPPYYGAQSKGDLEVAGVPASTNGSGTGTTGHGTLGGAGTSGSTPTPTSNGTDDGAAHESAACAMGHAPASSGAFALLAMLGALFGLKRRRN